MEQVRNLRIGAMMRTVLPALAQAVAMNSSPHFRQERTVESLKDELQVLFADICSGWFYSWFSHFLWSMAVGRHAYSLNCSQTYLLVLLIVEPFSCCCWSIQCSSEFGKYLLICKSKSFSPPFLVFQQSSCYAWH